MAPKISVMFGILTLEVIVIIHTQMKMESHGTMIVQLTLGLDKKKVLMGRF